MFEPAAMRIEEPLFKLSVYKGPSLIIFQLVRKTLETMVGLKIIIFIIIYDHWTKAWGNSHATTTLGIHTFSLACTIWGAEVHLSREEKKTCLI